MIFCNKISEIQELYKILLYFFTRILYNDTSIKSIKILCKLACKRIYYLLTLTSYNDSSIILRRHSNGYER